MRSISKYIFKASVVLRSSPKSSAGCNSDVYVNALVLILYRCYSTYTGHCNNKQIKKTGYLTKEMFDMVRACVRRLFIFILLHFILFSHM